MENTIRLEDHHRLQEIADQVSRETAANRVEHNSFKRRLDELEESGKRQSEILVTLQKQADAIESMNGKIDSMADKVEGAVNKISELEREPGEKWKKISFEIVKYVVLAIAGAAVGYFLKGGI